MESQSFFIGAFARVLRARELNEKDCERQFHKFSVLIEIFSVQTRNIVSCRNRVNSGRFLDEFNLIIAFKVDEKNLREIF